MKKFYFLYIAVTIAILFSNTSVGQVSLFNDNFDSYTVSQQLSCQNPTDWKTWTNNPCNATEDAYISNSYSFSGSKSLFIVQSNDIVREIGTPLTSGQAEINFRVYIPSGKSGYFNTLANFDPPNYSWAMQAFFNTPGTGTLDAGGANAATFNYPQDQWFLVRVVADLQTDLGYFYINGSLIHTWQWTLGTFGGTIAKQIDATNFYGNAVTDEMYVDDYNIVHTPFVTKIVSTAIGGNWSSASTWVGGNVPARGDVAEIVSGSTVTLTNNPQRDVQTIVNGTLNCRTSNYLRGTGSFILSASATLQIGSANGITASGNTGNIRVTGTRTFSPFANYIYNGTATQVSGNGLPANVSSLTINNVVGVTLTSSTTVSDNLILQNGQLLTGSNSLTLGTSITNTGNLSRTSGYVTGNFIRWLNNPSSPVLFSVGAAVAKYTPVTLNNISGAGTFTVSAISGRHPNAVGTNVLQMYWRLSNSGLTSADLTFEYLETDVVGTENNYVIGKYDGTWTFPGGTINTTTNQATITGVTSFSDWSLGEQSALPVELSSFSASVVGNSVKLNWKTETEVNNYGFDVERNTPLNPLSRGEAEGRGVWEKIGFVNGNGNSNSPKSYSFTDTDVLSGKYSYRLKQIDNDGQFEYSKTIEVDLGAPTKFELSQNYPNPFNPTTTIRFSLPEASDVNLTLFNVLGQEIKTLVKEFKESGVHTINFDASDLNSGIYIYRLEAGSQTLTRKMTLIK
jgi:hypothetical protein